MAELADAYGSGPYESNLMKVQVLSPAPSNADASWSNPEAFLFSSRFQAGGAVPGPTRAPPVAKVLRPGPGAPPHGESAPQILGYLRFLLNWANVIAKVPRRFWGTKRAAQRARRGAREAGGRH